MCEHAVVLNERIMECESSEPYQCVECKKRILAGEDHIVVTRLVLLPKTEKEQPKVMPTVHIVCHSCDADWKRILEIEFRVHSFEALFTLGRQSYGDLRQRIMSGYAKGGYIKDDEAEMYLRWKHGTEAELA